MSYKRVKSRPTIGFFIDWAENPYHSNLISGVQDKAKEKEINLIIFVGGCINSQRKWEIPRNIVYDFVVENTLDGLIISSGSIGHYSTTTQIKGFVYKYTFLPVISISQRIEGVPSILVDNTSGLKKMILHLIKDHHYKNIAMIKGPPGNLDANLRFQIYCETLNECGYPYDKNLIVCGDFIFRSGIAATKQLLKRNIPVDAIFAANDDMALGAIKVLKDNKQLVPGGIAVVGFDDHNISKYSSPPLTTIRQPIYEQGSRAVELVLDLLKGKHIPEEISLSTEFIIRESCGCFSKSLLRLTTGMKPAKNRTGVPVVAQDNKNAPGKITREVKKISRGTINPLEIQSLLSAFSGSCKKNDPREFLKALKSLLEKKATSHEDEIFWQNIISEMRRIYNQGMYPGIDNAAILKNEENFWHYARISISEYFQRRFNYIKAITEEETKNFGDINEELVSIIDMEDILKLLTRELKNLGIRGFVLSLYEKKEVDPSPIPDFSRMIFAFETGSNENLKYETASYPSKDLFPPGILSEDRHYSFFIEPIFFGTYQLGIAFLEYGEKKDPVYTIMRKMFINSALKATIYIKQVQIHSMDLEAQAAARTDALTKANRLLAKLYHDRKSAEDEVRRLNEELEQRVIERTAQLEAANEKLKNTLETLQSTQDKLVESEKMAALGGLVAGIAHEINTPVGIGVTAASHLDTITRDLSRMYNQKILKRSDLEKYIRTSQTAAVMVLSNLKRAYDLIKSFKKIAVDQSSDERRKFNVKEYINEILISLQPELKKTSHYIVINCPDTIVMDSFPGPFSQIITNLVMNSLIHAYDDGESGNIQFDVAKENNSVILTYSDDGKGIDASHLEKIFNPFFTTKRRKGGTGLGLHLLYNIVTRTFGGTVKCMSTLGDGTAFTITFPL